MSSLVDSVSRVSSQQMGQRQAELVKQLLRILQYRLLRFYEGDQIIEQPFVDSLRQNINAIANIEQQQPSSLPRYVDTVREIAEYLKLNFETVSKASSSLRSDLNSIESQGVHRSNIRSINDLSEVSPNYGEPQLPSQLKLESYLAPISQNKSRRSTSVQFSTRLSAAATGTTSAIKEEDDDEVLVDIATTNNCENIEVPKQQQRVTRRRANTTKRQRKRAQLIHQIYQTEDHAIHRNEDEIFPRKAKSSMRSADGSSRNKQTKNATNNSSSSNARFVIVNSYIKPTFLSLSPLQLNNEVKFKAQTVAVSIAKNNKPVSQVIESQTMYSARVFPPLIDSLNGITDINIKSSPKSGCHLQTKREDKPLPELSRNRQNLYSVYDRQLPQSSNGQIATGEGFLEKAETPINQHILTDVFRRLPQTELINVAAVVRGNAMLEPLQINQQQHFSSTDGSTTSTTKSVTSTLNNACLSPSIQPMKCRFDGQVNNQMITQNFERMYGSCNSTKATDQQQRQQVPFRRMSAKINTPNSQKQQLQLTEESILKNNENIPPTVVSLHNHHHALHPSEALEFKRRVKLPVSLVNILNDNNFKPPFVSNNSDNQ